LTPVNAVGLAAGRAHTCAVVLAGAAPNTPPAANVSCWGANGRGQLGTGDAFPRNKPTLAGAPLVNVKDVAASGDHTCTLHADGSLSCWGDSTDGAAGTGARGVALQTPATVVQN